MILILSFLFSSTAFAGSETRTLPKGRFGIVLGNVYATGTDYQYTKDGEKKTVGDANKTSIKDQALAMGARNSVGAAIFNKIIDFFNQSAAGRAALASARSFVDGVDLGTMTMNVKSTANVTSPTLMGSVTDKWMVIVNIPYVRMKTEAEFVYTPGKTSDQLDQLSAMANSVGITGIPNRNQFTSLARQALIDKGYKPPDSREKKFLGDIRLMNVVDLGGAGKFAFGGMNTIGLPTGPKHDPDDIFDSGAFHIPFIEQELTAVYSHTRKFRSYYTGGVRYNLGMKEKFRVPLDNQDFSPDKAQTETVTRTVGLSTFVETGLKYRLHSRWEVLGGLIRKTKAVDKFEGDQGSNYEAMGKMYPNVPSEALIYKVQLKYDPLTYYKMGRVPVMADISYEETFAGKNAPALKQLMFSIATFF